MIETTVDGAHKLQPFCARIEVQCDDGLDPVWDEARPDMGGLRKNAHTDECHYYLAGFISGMGRLCHEDAPARVYLRNIEAEIQLLLSQKLALTKILENL